ncbi:class I SAM-dependent methyltransferase [Bacteroidota bacterium]
MHTAEYPEYVARFYDLIYDSIRSGIDNEYFMNKISESKGPVLEIGVGTGRFYVEALNKGSDIYGIDISKSMIDILLSKIDKKYHKRISLQNATDYKFDRKFDLIIGPFRIFSHLIEVEDQIKALNNIYDHLSEDGIFIFDLFVPNLKMLIEGLHDHTDFEGEYENGKKFKRIVSMESDQINQINHVKMKFVWDNNGVEQSKEWSFPFRIFHRYEIEHLIKLSKLKLINIFGDYKENKLQTNSKEFIIVCRKA